jgi:hypothetical protein
MRFVGPLLCCLPLCLPPSSGAQQSVAPASAQAPITTGTVVGLVTDEDGALVQGATIIVTDSVTKQQHTTVSASDGRFRLNTVPAGTLTIAVTANGLQPNSVQATLQAEQMLELPPIALRVAAANTSVDVTLTRQEIAEEDIHVEEQQRLLGVIPNFYVVYDWHAPPLTTKQKFKLADRAIIDPANFVIIGGIAGIEQASNGLSGYGPGASGYGKRYAAGLADFTIGAWLGGALLPTVFHQDPRYFYMGKGTIRHRALYALATSVVSRGDNGSWQPAYAAVVGDFASGAISNLYYPASNRTGAGLTVENGLIGIGFNGVGNLIQEFVLRRITPASNKPAPAIP